MSGPPPSRGYGPVAASADVAGAMRFARETLERLRRALPPQYVVQRELGAGGMAIVFLAEDTKHHRPVAVKVLPNEFSGAMARPRFLREIGLLAKLNHPGIVQLFDSGVTDEAVYLVMPYVPGESLREVLARERQLPIDRTVRIARDVGEALAYAHGQGVLHRDVKPGNILLSSGRALVADFGLAHQLAMNREAGASTVESLTSDGATVGTPAYMSPEQVAGGPVDARSDIWSLGCVVYEMLAGTPPFTGATPIAVFARARSEAPPSLEVVRPGVGRAMQAVVERALARVPADRWQTALEFVEALEAAAEAPESAELIRRSRGRMGAFPRRWGRVGLAVGAAAAAVAAALALWPRPAPPLDADKVAGFPLRAQAGVGRDVAEQVYTVLENALVHTEPLRWVPGERWLVRAPGDSGVVSGEAATAVARRQGARWWITGTLSAVGDSLSVALELYDARADTLVDRVVRSAPASAPAWLVGLRAVNALLPRIVGRSTHVDAEVLAGYAPAAVVHWLAGERAYREARYDSAMAYYERALGEDSSMAFAALRGAMAAAWTLDAEGFARAAGLVRLALAHEDRLPRRNAAFAHGFAFLFQGDGDSALAWFRRSVQLDSGWSEGWYGVGEAYSHLAPSGTGQDSLARDAYARSLALAPDFAPVAFHLAELALLAGDRRAADSLIERHARLSRDSSQLVTIGMLRACTRDGVGAVAWRPLAAKFPNEVLDVGRMLAGGGRYPRCGEAALWAAIRSPAPDPEGARVWSSSVGLHHLGLMRGDTAFVRRFVDSVTAAGGRLSWAVGAYRLFDAVAEALPDAWARNSAAAIDIPLERAATIDGWLEWIGWWATRHGTPERLDSVSVLLARRARRSGKGVEAAWSQAMDAWATLRRTDTLGALARFALLRPVAGVSKLAFGFWEPLALERLTYARLLASQRRYADVIRVAGSFDRGLSLVDLVFLPASLALRRDAALHLGRRDLAARYDERLAALGRREPQ